MIRAIIQLTEGQSRILKEMSAEYQVSVSELVRQGVDLLTQSKSFRTKDDIYQRAMAAAGFIPASMEGPDDLSINHDKYNDKQIITRG